MPPDEPLLPPEPDVPPPDVPPPPELPLEGALETAGLLPPDDGLGVLTEGVLRAGVAVLTEELPDPPERLSGRLYVALLLGLEYVEPPEEVEVELLLSGVTLLV